MAQRGRPRKHPLPEPKPAPVAEAPAQQDDEQEEQERREPGVISSDQAAALIKSTRQWLEHLHRTGWVKKHGRNAWRVVDVVHGYIDYLRDEMRKNTKSESAKRAVDARAREIELKIAIKSNTLMETAEAISTLDEIFGIARSEITGFPARLTRDPMMRQRAQKAVDDLLNRISDRLTQARTALAEGGAFVSPESEDDA